LIAHLIPWNVATCVTPFAILEFNPTASSLSVFIDVSYEVWA
jgi:hypothetical protein